jgi:cobalt-zinc-cadmium efflux system protein
MLSQHSHIHTNAKHNTSITINKMYLAVLITLLFCILEGFIGYAANSLSLIADAVHNLTDAFALALSAFALWAAKKPSANKMTFGYHRVGILVALFNSLSLIFVAALIFWEALKRFKNPEIVNANPMILLAILAVIMNTAIAWWLSSSAKNDLNIKSAYIHMLGDAAASLAIVIAGIIIYFTGAYIADPIISIIFGILVLCSCFGTVSESVQILLEAAPKNIDLEKVHQAICDVQGVITMHDLHVWTIASGFVACSCHIVIKDQSISNSQLILQNINTMLEHDFGISHFMAQTQAE